MDNSISAYDGTSPDAHAWKHHTAGTQPRVLLDDDGALGNRRECTDTRGIGMRGRHQRDPRSDAHPITDRNITPLGKLLDDEQIVRDVHIPPDSKAAEAQQADSPARKEGVPGPSLQDFLPKTPREAHELSEVAVEARAESGD